MWSNSTRRSSSSLSGSVPAPMDFEWESRQKLRPSPDSPFALALAAVAAEERRRKEIVPMEVTSPFDENSAPIAREDSAHLPASLHNDNLRPQTSLNASDLTSTKSKPERSASVGGLVGLANQSKPAKVLANAKKIVSKSKIATESEMPERNASTGSFNSSDIRMALEKPDKIGASLGPASPKLFPDSEDDVAHSATARKRKKYSVLDDTRWTGHTGKSRRGDSNITPHLMWPQILIGYLRLFFTIFTMGVAIYVICQFIWTVHHDLQMKAMEYSYEISQQVRECSKSYLENRCAPVSERLPAMQSLCAEWEICMARDPREVGQLKVGAETLAEILNKLFEPMTYKTMVFGSILFFGTVFLWFTAPSITSQKSALLSTSTTAQSHPPIPSHMTSSMYSPSNAVIPTMHHSTPTQHHHYYGSMPPNSIWQHQRGMRDGSFISRRSVLPKKQRVSPNGYRELSSSDGDTGEVDVDLDGEEVFDE